MYTWNQTGQAGWLISLLLDSFHYHMSGFKNSFQTKKCLTLMLGIECRGMTMRTGDWLFATNSDSNHFSQALSDAVIMFDTLLAVSSL